MYIITLDNGSFALLAGTMDADVCAIARRVSKVASIVYCSEIAP